MVHMPSLEIWEWGLKIFRGEPTLTTHVDHLLFTQQTNTEQQTLHIVFVGKMAKCTIAAAGIYTSPVKYESTEVQTLGVIRIQL